MSKIVRYKIGLTDVNADDPALNEYLLKAYKEKIRPLCLCTPAGVPMHIVKVGPDRFLVKPMLTSGDKHYPLCDFYAPPPELSGLGQVLGKAIIEHPDGTVTLKLRFPMSKRVKRAVPAAVSTKSERVKK